LQRGYFWHMENKILVMGIGNTLLGDEGVGVHAVRMLENEELPDNVTLLDGGTAGFDLMSWLQDHERVIILDATMNDSPYGTINLIQPKFSKDFPNSLSAHDIGLRDLIEGMHLLGKAPKLYLFTVTAKEIQKLNLEMTEPVNNALPVLCIKVKELISELNQSPSR